MANNREKIMQLARDVLILSRNTLLVNLRFLDMALSQLELFPIDTSTLLTDGRFILFNPIHILENYKMAKEIPVRDYLHMVMHCVFRHMFMDPTLNRPYWDLACDIAVENVITELGLKSAAAPREQQQAQVIAAIKKELKVVSAEKIYAYLCSSTPDLNRVAQIRGLFYADNHEIWYMTAAEKEACFGLLPETSNSSEQHTGDCGNQDDDDISESDSGSSPSQHLKQISPDGYLSLSDIWQEIAERMQVDVEAFVTPPGNTPGALTQNLQAVNREKYDYASFLKKFAVMGEAMKINEDEFDYIFYTYGLQLYENMPLIEPLEYKEIKAIKEFVIAIDTSGSVHGDQVQRFVQKTYNILKSTESFFTKINLHILQCDTVIQESKKITSVEEFDEYIKTMKLRGFGGTDFRPVFDYVEKMRQNQEFTNLKGLIYFTDCYGEFPWKKPDYDVAFVLVQDHYDAPPVPPWAIRLILQKEEL